MRAPTRLVLLIALAAPPSLATAAPPAPPAIAGSHFTAADAQLPIAVVTPTSVILDDKPTIKLVKGEVAKADIDEKEGTGLVIPKLAQAIGALGSDYARPKAPAGQYRMGKSSTPFVIQVDASVPYLTLAQLMQTASKAGAKNFALVATEGGKRVLWNVMLPTTAEAMGSDPNDLGLTISIDAKSIIVWSTSERAGTLAKPAATIPLAKRGELAGVLAKIAKGEKTRPTLALLVPSHKSPVAQVYEVADIALGAGLSELRLSVGFE